MNEGNDSTRPTRQCPTEVDAILVALAHPYRRFLLEYLGEPNAAATITEIAAAVCTDADHTVGQVTGVDSVETALFHVHIPKLVEVGIVACDRDEGTVTLTDRWEDVRPILRAAEELRPDPS